MFILYDKDECPFCWRVRMALHRVGQAAEHRPHDDDAWRHDWPELTHFGTVPVLAIDADLALTDSRVILEYLHERYGGLWPDELDARARAREILCYADGVLGPAARDLIFECRGKGADERDPAVIDDAIERWHAALPDLASLLGDGDWFEGDCSIADYAVATRFGLALAYGMPSSGLGGPLRGWLDRVFARDEVASSAPRIVRQRLEQGGLV